MFWLIEGKLAGSPIPGRLDLEIWRDEEKISCIVSLVEDHEYLDGVTHKTMRDMGFEVLHIPIRDMTAPSVDQLMRAVKWIDECISKGKRVIVHCFGGYGRTGTVLAAYLIYKGKSAKEAIKLVRRVRGGAIMTREQEEILYIFEREIKRKK